MITADSLPTELWLHIFHFATIAPEAFISGDLPPTAPRPYVKRSAKRRLLRLSTRTARNLMLVCRRWSGLALAYLYRSIHIEDQQKLGLLWHTLRCSAQKASQNPGTLPLGWWSKRLEFTGSIGGLFVMWTFESLSGILSCMPNLAVMTFSVRKPASWYATEPIPATVIDIVKTTCARSLRVLVLDLEWCAPSKTDLAAIVSAAQNLRVLYCPMMLRSMDTIPRPFAPELKSLAISSRFWGDYQDLTEETNYFPSLQHLVYIAETPEFSQLSHFLRIHGSTLTSFELEDTVRLHHAEEMSLISQFCPNLVRLDMHVEIMTTISINIDYLPCVTILGLRCRKPPSRHLAYSLLAGLTKAHPALRIVQFLSRRNLADMQAQHADALSLMIKATRDKGIRLQDPNGFDLAGDDEVKPSS